MPETPTPWLDNYPPGVPEHVDLPKASLAGLLEDAARDFPHAPALHFEGRTISYAQVASQARRFSGALAAASAGVAADSSNRESSGRRMIVTSCEPVQTIFCFVG